MRRSVRYRAATWSNMAIIARANAERHRLVSHVARLLELFGFDAPRVRMPMRIIA